MTRTDAERFLVQFVAWKRRPKSGLTAERVLRALRAVGGYSHPSGVTRDGGSFHIEGCVYWVRCRDGSALVFWRDGFGLWAEAVEPGVSLGDHVSEFVGRMSGFGWNVECDVPSD